MDPYKVLGIDQSATDDEVKSAYRTLVKQYHPDKYVNNPLGDLASEKLKEINMAYDDINRMRQNKGTSNSYGGGYSSSTDSRFNAVRGKIAAGDLTSAEAMLDAIADKNAEWHYLKGVVLHRRGWYDGAKQHFGNAYNMDPGNPEYSQAYNSVNNAGQGFGDFYGSRNTGNGSGCSICDLCAGLACLNCFCDCCG